MATDSSKAKAAAPVPKREPGDLPAPVPPPPPPPPLDAVPPRRPGDFSQLAGERSPSGALAVAAGPARREPGTWVFVSYTNDDRSNHLSWKAAVQRGAKKSLGGTEEQWDAEVVRGYLDDAGAFVVDDEYPYESAKPTYAKFIAYLGPRASNGEVG